MYELRTLLDRFWVTRDADPALYFSLKRAHPEYRRFVSELLGWNLVANESVIKLEKVPPKAMPWMGIQTFTDELDYCLLCALLLYLADLDDGAQFLLSSLTQAAETYLAEVRPVDWTRFAHRKSLVRVLQYAQETGLLLVYDGSSEGFGSDQSQEVLYENTGLSRCFPVHFGRDISGCRNVEDFEAFSAAEDAHGKRRAYRQLALSPALYWAGGERGDYDYVKAQRQWVCRRLQQALGGDLHLHKNGAFFVLEENEHWGQNFPGGRALHDVILLLCGQLRARVLRGEYRREADDTVRLTRREFRQEVQQLRLSCGEGWGKELRTMQLDRLCEALIQEMSGWMMLREQDGEPGGEPDGKPCRKPDGELLLYPAAGKWTGAYPETYRPKNGKGETDEPMEDA